MNHSLRSLTPGFLAGAALLVLAPMVTQCTEPLTPNTNLISTALNNTAPVARAGAGGEAAIGAPLTLDGTGSYDPDGDEIIFIWSVDSAPEASEIGANPFSANEDRNAGVVTVNLDVEGIYIFALVVEDANGTQSDTDYVVYEANSALEPPVADAGPNVTGLEGTEACLDGSNSHDPGGADLVFNWSIVSLPEGSLLTTADLTAAESGVCFEPDAPGTYAIALVVDNGLTESEPDFAFVAAGSTNQGPTAAADITSAASCDFIVLTGGGSTDPEDDALFFNWDLLVVPPGSAVPLGQSSFDDPQSETPRFYADVEGEYTVQLVVNDGEDYSTPVFLEVAVQLTDVNEPPVVHVSPDAYFASPSPGCAMDSYGNCTSCPNCGAVTVPLDALETTDPDEDIVHITWEIVTGPANTTLAVEEGFINELTMPGPAGSCTTSVNTYQAQVQVTATDCVGDTATGLITVVYDCGG
ncbi:MAG: hypothetical protein GY898_22925 [Proteobacteria bacterium]|nr:hypothetical protein [Pseudomonadota bacterium]